MTFLQMLFYFFSTLSVFSGAMVVGSSNPVRSALFLVLAFFSTAVLWILLHAEFLALVLVLVYVGAVMTLFLFVVMMLSVQRITLREGLVRYWFVGVILVLLTVGIIYSTITPDRFALIQLPVEGNISNTVSLGNVLYTRYAYPFEVAGALLLTAIVAAIVLTHRPGHQRKNQKTSQQIAVRAKDRLRIVKGD